MTDWPKYRSHKIVEALPIVAIEEEPLPSGHGMTRLLFVEPDDKGRRSFFPSVPAMAERAEVGDYAVRYDDGFRSISPRAAFEDGYTRVEP
jgi:hypothetical protein